MLPKRIKRPKKETRLRSPAHLKWIRGFACSIPGCFQMPIEAAHVRNGTDGALAMKPGDNWAISLCHAHHAEQHCIGEKSFEKKYGVDLKRWATEFWARSPHGERKQRAKPHPDDGRAGS